MSEYANDFVELGPSDLWELNHCNMRFDMPGLSTGLSE